MTTASTPISRAFDRLASLVVVVAGAFCLRVAAAAAVQWAADPRGTLCLFPDTDTYWALAETIRRGTTYVIFYDTQPHYALRTPGYPIFLATCRWAFGARALPARLVQAALGAASVAMVERLTRRAVPGDLPVRGRWTVPLVAAALAAAEPYTVFTSAFLLSEAVFLPLMMAGQWFLAGAWDDGEGARPRRAWAWASGMGLASGTAVLVRPSWALFVPATLAAWIALAGRGRRRDVARLAAVATLAAALVMAPWWARNARIYGRFVPTALWAGASLYDGLNPRATGASDMDFLNDPDIRPLGEQEQDALLHERAVAFARSHPGRTTWLAAVKFARFWTPWPNAVGFRSPILAASSAAVTIPLFALIAVGLHDRRRDPRALTLLAGPLLYTCALHLVFVGSMRYRIVNEVPAFGLAAIGLRRLIGRRCAEGGPPGVEGGSSPEAASPGK